MPPKDKLGLFKEGMDITEAKLASLIDEQADGIGLDHRALRRASFFSPSLLFLSSATELAGTGLQNQIYFSKALKSYLKYFNGNTLKEMKVDLETPGYEFARGRYSGTRDRTPPIFTMFKPFKWSGMALGQRVETTMWSFLALACYAVLFFMLAFLAFIKIEIT